MKVISIGRNPDNDIVIHDNMVSRNHALIKVHPFGKYEIVSVGSNGTKVNGNPIAPNQPYPLKRGDSVIFSQRVNLDWDRVPNPLKPFYIGGIIVAIVLVLFCLALIFISLSCHEKSIANENTEGQSPVIENLEDSVKNDTIEAEQKKEEKSKAFSFPDERKEPKAEPEKKKVEPGNPNKDDSGKSSKDDSKKDESKAQDPQDMHVRIK